MKKERHIIFTDDTKLLFMLLIYMQYIYIAMVYAFAISDLQLRNDSSYAGFNHL
jgi:hypothetical protein